AESDRTGRALLSPSVSHTGSAVQRQTTPGGGNETGPARASSSAQPPRQRPGIDRPSGPLPTGTRGLIGRRPFNHRQVAVGGAIDYLALRSETGAMTGAVPDLLRVVPVDDAAQVRAHRRPLVGNPFLISVNRDLLQTAAEHRSP